MKICNQIIQNCLNISKYQLQKGTVTQKMLNLIRMKPNLNCEFQLSLPLQNSLANQNVAFMLELARQLKLTYTLPTLALQISIDFFHQKSYVNYDRFIILTAALFLASKLKNMEIKFQSICHAFYNVFAKKTLNIEPFNEEKMLRIRDALSINECTILRALEFKIDLITPLEYVKSYCDWLFLDQKELCKKIYSTVKILIFDSYRSRVSIEFSPSIIFISCLMQACRLFSVTPYETKAIKSLCKENKHVTSECLFKIFLESIKNREKEQIDAKKIRDCIEIINSSLYESFR